MQDRNAEMVVNLTQDFTTRDEFAQSGARLADVMQWQNRDAGGGLMFGFPAQGAQALGDAATTGWTQNTITTYGNYAAVVGRGGPYCILDGPAAADYLSITSAAWMDTGGASLLVWAWVDVDAMLGSDMTVAARWLVAGNERSWWLYLDTTAEVFELLMSVDGTAEVTAASTVTVGTTGFYFVAAHYEPSTSVTFGVAAASAHTRASGVNTVTASIPAALNDPTADLTIGSISGGPGNWWDGYIGGTLGRVNVPVTNIASHMARLYGATYWLYGG